jgi:hypothetical protein
MPWLANKVLSSVNLAMNLNLKPFFDHLLGNHWRVQLPTLVGAERKQQ